MREILHIALLRPFKYFLVLFLSVTEFVLKFGCVLSIDCFFSACYVMSKYYGLVMSRLGNITIMYESCGGRKCNFFFLMDSRFPPV